MLSRHFIGIWATICSLLVSFISFILSFFHPFILSSLRYCALSCFMRFFHFIPCDFTSLDFISCHFIQSFTGLLFESLNRWTIDSLIHWLIASLWWSGSMIRWFVDALIRWMTENHRWFIDLFDLSNRWFIDSLVPWFNDSLILWIVGSSTHSVDCDSWFHWLVALLTHWVVEPLVHCDLFLYCFIESLNSDTDSLIPWFIASLPLSFSCAVILSRHFIGHLSNHLLIRWSISQLQHFMASAS